MTKKTFLDNLIGNHSRKQKPEKVLERAHKKAEGIVSQAVVKAESLIDETNIFDEKIVSEYQALLEQQLADINRTYLEKYQKTLDRLEKSIEEKFNNNFREQLETVKKEIDAYKKNQIVIIDQQIKEKVNQIATKVFNQSLNNNQVSELIIKALEQAEKQGVFNG